MINIGEELIGDGYDPARAKQSVERIEQTLRQRVRAGAPRRRRAPPRGACRWPASGSPRARRRAVIPLYDSEPHPPPAGGHHRPDRASTWSCSCSSCTAPGAACCRRPRGRPVPVEGFTTVDPPSTASCPARLADQLPARRGRASTVGAHGVHPSGAAACRCWLTVLSVDVPARRLGAPGLATCCSCGSSATTSRTGWDGLRFLVFYLLGGVAAIALQSAFDTSSGDPHDRRLGRDRGRAGGYLLLYPPGGGDHADRLDPGAAAGRRWCSAVWFVLQLLERRRPGSARWATGRAATWPTSPTSAASCSGCCWSGRLRSRPAPRRAALTPRR